MEAPNVTVLNRESISGLPIHGKLVLNRGAQKLICFMPAALPKKLDRDPLQLSRFRWRESLTKYHVLALADPAMTLHSELLGGWYIHPEADLIAEMADLVSDQAKVLGLKNSDVLFYGSSLGGYGALAMASLLKGSTAIAEVPQIDVSKWTVRIAVKAIEQHILKQGFDEFRLVQPHKVDLRDRFRLSGFVPQFKIITNEKDATFALQNEFMSDIKNLGIPSYGVQRLDCITELSGHKALGKELVINEIDEWASTSLI